MPGAFDSKYSMTSPESMQCLARTSGHNKLGNCFQWNRKVCRYHFWNLPAADNQCKQWPENQVEPLHFPRRQKQKQKLGHLCGKLLLATDQVGMIEGLTQLRSNLPCSPSKCVYSLLFCHLSVAQCPNWRRQVSEKWNNSRSVNTNTRMFNLKRVIAIIL